MENRLKMLVNDTVLFTIGTVGARLITFVLVPLYTNCLTAGELGQADLIVTFAQLLYPIASLTIHDALLRFGISKYYNKKSIITNVIIYCGIAIIIISIVSPFFAFYKITKDWILFLFLISVFSLINVNLLNTLKIQDKNRYYVVVNILYTLMLALLNMLFLLVLNMGIQGYLLAQIIALIISIIIMLFLTQLRQNFDLILADLHLIKELITYSAPLTINNISWWGMNSAGKIIIERFSSASDLGIYTIASKLPALQSVFTSAFSQAWTLAAVKEYERNNDEKFYIEMFNCYNFGLTLLNACILLVLEPLLSLFLGKDFLRCEIYVPTLLVGNIFYSYALFFSSFYAAAKKNKAVTMVTIIGAITLVIVGVILTPYIGLWGTVFAVLLGNIVYSSAGYIGCRKIIKMQVKFPVFNINTLITFILTITVTLDFYSTIFCALGIAILILKNRGYVRKGMFFLHVLLRKKASK